VIEQIRAKARELLENGTVDTVIGYEEGSTGRVRPAFIHTPDEVDRLIFDERCDQNLIQYLNQRNKPQKKNAPLPKTAVVTKPCDARSLQVLLNEHQILRENVTVIGIACPGLQGPDGAPAPRCTRCTQRIPAIYDVLYGEAPDVSEIEDIYEDIDAIEALPVAERLAYWMGMLDRCIRCYACRQACPTCFCTVCEADRDDNLWIGMSSDIPEKMFFHVIRAFHNAGRCTECGSCEMVCPMGIPLSLLNRKLVRDMREMFQYQAGMDDSPMPLYTELNGEEEIDEVEIH
jgi:formate dehydrogenase (coenzyme F420) beta subunit